MSKAPATTSSYSRRSAERPSVCNDALLGADVIPDVGKNQSRCDVNERSAPRSVACKV